MPGASRRGRFITLEGVDGAGKSTHIPWIKERLSAGGREVVVTREPGGTPLAEQLRARILAEKMDARAETELVFRARADHVQKVIRPALERGAWVLCDRFTDSTVAYQGAGNGAPRALIEKLAAEVHPDLKPDLTLVFDASYQVSRERLAGRALDKFEAQGVEFFDRVRQAYQDLARAHPERIRVIDGSRSLNEVKAEIEKWITRL